MGTDDQANDNIDSGGRGLSLPGLLDRMTWNLPGWNNDECVA